MTEITNYSTAIFLINSDVRAVRTSYDRDAEGKAFGNLTTYKTFDQNAAVGDFVIAPTDTRHKLTVVRIEEVDVEIDVDCTENLKWLAGTVDTAARDAVEAMEAEAIAKIKSAQKKARQDDLRAKLIADNPELSTLASINGPDVQALPAE